MTKEEMANAYAEGFEDEKYRQIAYDAFLCGFTAKCEPSLPSNLDEAAEEYAYTNWEDNDYHTGASEGLPFDAIGHTEKCFKAGAKWMKEQGVSLSHLIAWYIQSVDANEPVWTKEHIEELVKDYILIPKS